MGERLLDHQQIIGVELAEVIRVGERVGRVGVDREHDPRVPPADLADDRDVRARLDLELDAAVAETEIATHALVQGVHAGLDAQAHSDLDPVAHSSDETGDGLAAQPRDEVHERELDSRLGHGVAAERAEARSQVVQVADLLAEDRGAQVVADDVARGADRLVAVEGGLPGHAFAPSRMAAGIEPDQEDEPRRHGSEAHLEGLEQGQAHEAQLERVQAHGGGRPDRNNRCDWFGAHSGRYYRTHGRPPERSQVRPMQQMVSALRLPAPVAFGVECAPHERQRDPHAVPPVRPRGPRRPLLRRHRTTPQQLHPADGAECARRGAHPHRCRAGPRQRDHVPSRALVGGPVGSLPRPREGTASHHPGRARPGRRRHGGASLVPGPRPRRTARRDGRPLRRDQPDAGALPGARGRPGAVAVPIARHRLGDLPDVRRRHRVPDAGAPAGHASGLPDRRGHRARHRPRLPPRSSRAPGAPR